MTGEKDAPAEMPGEIVERIATFLKLRDEMVPDPDERTDEERSESAKGLAAIFAPILAEKEREIERMKQTRLLLDRRIHCQRMSNRANWMIVEQRSFWMRRAAQYFVRRGKARLEARALAAEAALATERERCADLADMAAEREDARAFENDGDLHVAECRGAERAAKAIAAAIRAQANNEPGA